jgi:hypothetical protein
VAFTYDVTTPRGQVRLLLNDVDAATAVFHDAEIDAFLALEGASVKLAAAQAIDTNATNEALASKVIKDHQQQTDGAKVADAMRKHAAGAARPGRRVRRQRCLRGRRLHQLLAGGHRAAVDRVLVMPRPRQAQGRPGTPVIPAGWAESHAQVIDRALSTASTVTIGPAGGTSGLERGAGPHRHPARGRGVRRPAELMAVSDTARALTVVEDPVKTRVYDVTLPYAASAGIESRW